MHSYSVYTKNVLIVQKYILPPKKLTPRIAKINHTASTTTRTFRYAPPDPSSAETIAFMPEFLEMNLKGLRALSILKTLITGMLIEATAASSKDATTMKKSN